MMCGRAREETCRNLWQLYSTVKKLVEVRMLRRSSNSEVVQSLMEANTDFARKRAWNLHKDAYKIKGTLSRHDHRTEQLEKVVASWSGCHHEDREFIVDSGASLHMMSKKEHTSGENANHQKIGRSHRHHHDRQRKG